MYFGRKHGGGGILRGKRWKHASACRACQCVQSWHTHAGCLGKLHLQLERRSHWRVLSLAHTQSEWLLLLFVSLSCSRAVSFLCSLGAERTQKMTDPRPISFAGMNVEQFLREGEDLAIWPCCTPGLSWGPTLILSWAEQVLPQPNPYMLVTLDPTTTWKPSRKSPMGWLCLPRKAIITCEAGIISPRPRIFLPLAQYV